VTDTTQPARPKRFGDFEFDSRARQLRKHGHTIRLHGQPLEILGLLLERPAEVVLREELRARLWPEDTFVDFEHSLNAAVNKLREALDDDANNPVYRNRAAARLPFYQQWTWGSQGLKLAVLNAGFHRVTRCNCRIPKPFTTPSPPRFCDGTCSWWYWRLSLAST
jgi:hypothetical protein